MVTIFKRLRATDSRVLVFGVLAFCLLVALAWALARPVSADRAELERLRGEATRTAAEAPPVEPTSAPMVTTPPTATPAAAATPEPDVRYWALSEVAPPFSPAFANIQLDSTGWPQVDPAPATCVASDQQRQAWEEYVDRMTRVIEAKLGQGWALSSVPALIGQRLLVGDACRGPVYDIRSDAEARAAVQWSINWTPPPPVPASMNWTPPPAPAWVTAGGKPPGNPNYRYRYPSTAWRRETIPQQCYATDAQARRWQEYQALVAAGMDEARPSWRKDYITGGFVAGVFMAGDACRGPVFEIYTLEEARAAALWSVRPVQPRG